MNVSFAGIGQTVATFMGGAGENQVVKLTGNGTVGPCGAGDLFCGVVLCRKEDASSVQVGGFVTVSYSGTAPAVGYANLTADGSGGVTAVSEGGLCCLVADVDTDRRLATILL